MGSQRHRAFPRLGIALLPASGAAVLLLVLGALAIAQAVDRPAVGPVYAVAALRAHLARDPDVWVDRPLRVRAIATDLCAAWLGMAHTTPCLNRHPALTDADTSLSTEALPLARGGVRPLVAFLRRQPLVGRFAPPLQEVHWGAVATYWVSLRPIAHGLCGAGACYEAALLAATP